MDARDVRRQPGGAGRHPARPRGAAAGRAVCAGTARRGPRRAPARLSGSRLRERDGRRPAASSARTARTWPCSSPSARGRRCSSTTCSSSATCGPRRQTIERELQVKRGRSVQPERDQRQPAAADRARPVPPRAHHRAAPRRRDDARSAGDDRGSAGRRRSGYGGGVEGEAARRRQPVGGRRGQRAVRGRAAGVLRGRPPQRVRQEPLVELLFQPARFTRRGTTRRSITEYRVVGTFREPRVFDTSADAFVNTTFEQQTRSSFNFSRRSLSADVARHLTPRRQRHRHAISSSGRACSTNG